MKTKEDIIFDHPGLEEALKKAELYSDVLNCMEEYTKQLREQIEVLKMHKYNANKEANELRLKYEPAIQLSFRGA